MEYLEGEDLARLLARQGFLSPAQAADIMLPVTAAIATAHEQGVIHRDLKPENIFLSRSAYGAVHPKVLDFGISKVLGDSRARALTGTAATMGTMHYLPPEQLRAAREADARSNQYGLGTILYECVTGQRAFEEDSFYLLLKKIAEGEFDRPSLRRPGVPERLEAIVLRAMSLDPLGRFDSVKQLGAALLEFSSESTRMLWSPFFGAAPAIDMPASGSPLSNAPTLSGDASSSGSPLRARRPNGRAWPRWWCRRPHRRAPPWSCRSRPTVASRPAPPCETRPASARCPRGRGRPRAGARRRSSGGVALVAAISVLLILRGTGGGDRHDDAESTSAGAPSSTASRPVIAAPDEPKVARPIARPPEAKAPSTEPRTEPTPVQNPPAGAKTGSETAAADGEPAGTRREDSTPAHKVSSKGTRKGAAVKSGRAGKTTPAAPPQESSPSSKPDDTPKSPNGAPVISN